MTYQIERLVPVYSADKGDHNAWRKVRKQPTGAALEWNTRREAEGFVDLLTSRVGQPQQYRVVEVSTMENA